ncbi:nucleoside recognition protein [Sedimentibacter hydroxybenzoicus DSM 7310]|uniref:Nucleoside recognition protein n=1 Tax=Sedimentibacter hydroxybenzoicus DSM 7310 TaxID=1123245 RepID=A0A974GWP2_SEDHY|nr:nucleoside recognition domain-containing protein [Sedimentibacter hydroxybenzoicus]NYB74466.1 nucleoside recognition protein [Sedimentibacter hydroxybenzoicus DSM 7310]
MNAIIDIIINLISFIWSITKVLIPIMITIEIFKDTQLIDKLSKAIKPISNFFTISEKSGVSLLFGMTFGLTIGAGAIIQSVKDYDVDKRSIFLITMFLSVCHAVIEDSMIFAGVGANIAALLGARFISAILITFILSKFIKKDAFETEK